MEIFRVHFQVSVMELTDGNMNGVGFRRRQFTGDVVGCTRDCIDRMCLES